MKFCPSCGAQRLTETPCCTSCGADFRRLAAAMVAPAPRRSGRRTVRQYLAGVAANDADEVLQACAIDAVATHFQFDLQAERLQAILPTTFLLPSSYQPYAGLNRYGQAYQIFFELRGLSYSLLSSHPVDQTITPVTADQAQQLVKDLDYAVGFTLVRYGSDWKVLNQVSNLAGMPATGAAQQTTPGDFSATTGG